MIRDAEAHAAEDKKFRELAETRNRADALLHATEKSLKDLGDKVTGEERAAIEAAISDLRGVLKGDDQSAIEHKAEALAKASAPVVQRAYQAEGSDAASGADPSASAKPGADAAKDDVLDAEFEEIKDKGGKTH
jgi:molecular chaperone DnaK